MIPRGWKFQHQLLHCDNSFPVRISNAALVYSNRRGVSMGTRSKLFTRWAPAPNSLLSCIFKLEGQFLQMRHLLTSNRVSVSIISESLRLRQLVKSICTLCQHWHFWEQEIPPMEIKTLMSPMSCYNEHFCGCCHFCFTVADNSYSYTQDCRLWPLISKMFLTKTNKKRVCLFLCLSLFCRGFQLTTIES